MRTKERRVKKNRVTEPITLLLTLKKSKKKQTYLIRTMYIYILNMSFAYTNYPTKTGEG